MKKFTNAKLFDKNIISTEFKLEDVIKKLTQFELFLEESTFL
jgi:hypothetical protein